MTEDIHEIAQRRADEKFPRPKMMDTEAAMYGAIAGAIILSVFMMLAGLDMEYFGVPLVVCTIICGAGPYFFIRGLNNRNSSEFIRQLMLMEQGDKQ